MRRLRPRTGAHPTEPGVIRRILSHLGIPSHPPSIAPARSPPESSAEVPWEPRRELSGGAGRAVSYEDCPNRPLAEPLQTLIGQIPHPGLRAPPLLGREPLDPAGQAFVRAHVSPADRSRGTASSLASSRAFLRPREPGARRSGVECRHQALEGEAGVEALVQLASAGPQDLTVRPGAGQASHDHQIP